MRRTIGCFAALTVIVFAMTSCHTVRGAFGFLHGAKKAPAAPTETLSAPKTAADLEQDLRALVAANVDASEKSADASSARIIKRKPYFFRTYDVYPEGVSGMKVTLQETESKSVPYMADVTIAKQRFSTKLHRKRGEAERDVNFLRDTGAETATYELRSGKWTRAGSIFIANKSEENVNGEWMAVDETVKRIVPEEEKKAKGGWLKRAWSSFTGKEVDEKPVSDDKDSKKPKGTPGGSQSGMSVRRGF